MFSRHLKIIAEIEDLLTARIPEAKGILSFEKPPSLGDGPSFDLAIPCFPLAKVTKNAPAKIAEQLASELKHPSIETAQAVKGFLNIRFKADVLGKEIFARRESPLEPSAKSLAKETILVEYSSPNIAKPFGIGHLRSTNIGAAICRIVSSLGAKTIRINHLGDWGTQFGKLMTAYKHFGSAEFVKGDPINNLYKLYVEFHDKEKDDPALMDEARDWFVKLEKGDTEARELWTWFKDVSYHEFKKIYDRLGVDFDYVTGESFYNQLMLETIERLEKKKLLKDSEGARVVDLEPYGMPPCLILKTDGSTLYATRDLATAEYRVATFKPTKMVYVVGSEQRLHFRQFYKVLELMGYPWTSSATHVDFGLIKFPEGKMSTRKGNIILLEDVLNQAEKRAFEVIEEKRKSRGDTNNWSEAEKLEVARQVGSGAVIFFDLRAKRTKDVMFDWDDILNFEGNSGPYLQYTAVRLKALLEKAKDMAKLETPNLKTEHERELARMILAFPATVENAAREYEPSLISHYLLELAATFNSFYMNVHVIKGEKEELPGRLSLVRATLATLEKGLGLLGLEVPIRM